MFNIKCKIVLFLLGSAAFQVQLVHSSERDSVGMQMEQCKIEFKSCRKRYMELSFEAKYYRWDFKNKLLPESAIPKVRDSYFDYFSCQFDHKLCLAEKKSNRKEYLDSIASSQESAWEVSSPAKEGINNSIILHVERNAEEIKHLRSLLITKNEKLIFEKYTQFEEDLRPQRVESISKSIVSLLIGIAIDKGYISSENIVIKPYFNNIDPLKSSIKITDLLRMKSGIDFSDLENWGKTDVDNKHTYIHYWWSNNAKDYALQFEMTANPGGQFIYNSPSTDLLAAILYQSTNMTVGEFAEKYLFDPLDINNYLWVYDDNQYYYGSHGLFMRPRALAKIGQVILNNGVYKGNQLISPNWLDKTFESHQSGGVLEEYFATTGLNFDYGYLWYLATLNGYDVRVALGIGGNLIAIIPKANLVVVTTANPEVSMQTSANTIDTIFNKIVKLLVPAS